MSAINRVPPGLLSLLGIKSLGQNPVELGGALLPTLELGELYTEALIETITGAITGVNAVGQWEFTSVGTRAVPSAGELWIVRRVAMWPTAALGAGTSITFSPVTINSTFGSPTSCGAVVSGSAGQQPVAGHPAPFLMTSQTAMAVWVHAITLGVAPQISYMAQICRLQI